MRIIILILTVFLVSACISEVTPILKPTEVDIPHRIANLHRWLDQDVAGKSIDFQDAVSVRAKLKQIAEKYDRLQSTGTLTAKDSEEITKMLDQISELIFQLDQKKKKGRFKQS